MYIFVLDGGVSN